MAKTDTIISIEGYELPTGARDITPADSVGPVYLVPLTNAELAEREQWAIEAAQREIDEAAKADKRDSVLAAIAKATGLTKEDITEALA